MFASVFTPYLSRTWRTAFARGKPPRMRSSMFSPAFRPDPLPQHSVFSRMVSSGISWKWLHTLLMM